ncbi:MAG: hypothetical protein RLZZ341_2602 [Pseudomonadota bacterium]
MTPAATWWAAKIHANTAGPISRPKVCTVRRTEGGTVAMKSSPYTTAKSVSANIVGSVCTSHSSATPRRA